MTISSEVRKAGPFNGNDVTTSFPFTFKVFDKGDLRVVRTMPSGIEADLVLDSDYSVTLNGDQDATPGGTVTFPISGDPLPADWKLTVIGDIDALQQTDLTNQGGFFPQVIENSFDRLTMLIQQLEEELGRTIRISVSDSTTGGLQLPAAGSRPERVLGFDANGNFTTYPLATATLQAAYESFTATTGQTDLTLPFSYTPGVNAVYVFRNGSKLTSGVDYQEISETLIRLVSGAAEGDLLEVITGIPLSDSNAGLAGVQVRYAATKAAADSLSAGLADGATVIVDRDETVGGVQTRRVVSSGVLGAPVNGFDAGQVKFTQSGTGAVARTVQDKMREFVSVKDFGAVGDGVADDTVALQNACAACLAQNKTLYVKAGTYKLTGKITVPRGLTGDGSNVTFFQGVNAGVKSGNLMEFNGPGTYQGFTIDGAVSADPPSWNAGNYDSFTGWNNIYLMTNDITCIDIFSRNSAQAGFGAWSINRCLFINCRTQRTRNNFGDGFFAYLCQDFTYINCRAFDYTRIGFVFDGDGSTRVAERASYIDCYAEFGHDSSILYGGGENNAGYWCENHNNARYENCTAINNTFCGFVNAAADGGARFGYYGNCQASQSPTGYRLGTFSTQEKLSIVMDACSYYADGSTAVDAYSIGDNAFAILNGCSAKLDGGGSQTRVIGLGNNAKVDVNQFNEYWTNRPTANLYNINSAVASVGGFPGDGIAPDSFKVDGYKTLNTLEPCVIKWIGSPCSGGLKVSQGAYDIPRFNSNGGVEILNSVINLGDTTSRISGNMSRVYVENCDIANRFQIGWSDNLDQAVFNSCNFTRSASMPNIFFYRDSGTTYKPSRLKLINSTFSSNLETLNFYVQQNADPAVFDSVGQNILVTGCVFHNTGGATSNFAIRQEATSGLASIAYVGSSRKSSTITNVATYLGAGAVINDL